MWVGIEAGSFNFKVQVAASATVSSVTVTQTRNQVDDFDTRAEEAGSVGVKGLTVMVKCQFPC